MKRDINIKTVEFEKREFSNQSREGMTRRINMLEGLERRGMRFEVGKAINQDDLDELIKRAHGAGVIVSNIPLKDMDKIEKRSFFDSYSNIDINLCKLKQTTVRSEGNGRRLDARGRDLKHENSLHKAGYYKNERGQWKQHKNTVIIK